MSTIDDVERIPSSYFEHNLPGTPIKLARYRYLQHLKDTNQLDNTTKQLMDSPDFYYNYVNNISPIPSMPGDVLLQIALSMTNLDDVISMSMTSSYLNRVLKDDIYIQTIKHNIGIRRPLVLGWSDLLRENSKVHATRYAKLNQITSDYPTNFQLLINAIRKNNMELVEKYWNLGYHTDVNEDKYPRYSECLTNATTYQC